MLVRCERPTRASLLWGVLPLTFMFELCRQHLERRCEPLGRV